MSPAATECSSSVFSFLEFIFGFKIWDVMGSGAAR